MIIMCMCGVIGNSLSLYVYWTPTFRRRSINLLLAALSASDLFLCLLAMPVFSITQIQSFLPGLSKYLTGRILLFAYPVTLMLQSMSVWLLVSITIDRYLAVCYPFKVRAYCTRTRAMITIILIVFFSIVYNFVRFWEFTLDDSGGTSSIEESIIPLLRGDPLFMLLYQNIATLITQFFIPLIVLCFLNLHVARTILEAGVERRELVASERREYRTAKMMLYVVIVFIFCYALSMILNVAEILDEDLFRQPIGYLLNDINNILVVINSSSSFIFYVKYSTRQVSFIFITSIISFLHYLINTYIYITIIFILSIVLRKKDIHIS
uniref:G-protein coupled receptors family 1 profile domain-containing protein n=1 Tax=Parascaris equorum TaxID=6256 RepID=A0A914S087_PAREQ